MENKVKTRSLASFSGTWNGDSPELDRIQKDIHCIWKSYERELRRAE